MPNTLYKFRGKEGLEYAYYLDDLKRLSKVEARYVSPDEVLTNIVNLKNDINLGDDWGKAFKKLKETSKGNDVNVSYRLNYDNDALHPKYVSIEAKVRDKKVISEKFKNTASKLAKLGQSVTKNKEVVERFAKQVGMESDKVNKLLAEMSEDPKLAELIHENPVFNIQRWKNTRNHVDQSKIIKTSKGRFPPNARTYAGNTYYFNPHLNSGLKARLERLGAANLKKEAPLSYDLLVKLDKQYPDGVPFTKEGYPDFSKVAAKDANGNPMAVDIGILSGNSKNDINRAETMFQEMGYPWEEGFT